MKNAEPSGIARLLQRMIEFKQFPIRLKITLPYLFLVLVFSFGVALLASKIILETVDERFNNQLFEGGKIASEAVVNEEAQILSTLRLLANMEGVAEAIQEGDAEKLRELTLGTVINHQEEAVEFLNPQRILVLSLHHKKQGLVEEYDSAQGGDGLANWEIVQKASTGQADSLGDKYTAWIETDQGYFLYIATPLFTSDNQPAGVILIGKSLDSLARQVREETLTQVTFYDLNGKPLASTFSHPIALDSPTSALVIQRQDQDSYRRNFQSLDMNYGEILGPWESRGDMDLGLLGAALVKNILITASLPTRLQILLLISLTVFIVMLVGINVATLITRPLMRLVNASRIVSAGNLDIQVPISSRDEISDLAISFNQMIVSLNQSKKELLDSYDKTLDGWSKALELRDNETQGHSQRVMELTVDLARRMGFSEEQLSNLRRGSMMHDIGKMGVPDSILLKTGPLTPEEWEIMRRHPQYAYDMLGKIEFLKPALEIPFCHHEKWDGTGYPRGLQGEQIPLAARLFAIVDVWDALISHRPYREPLQPAVAMEFIREGSGSFFDPQLVTIFLAYVREKHMLDRHPAPDLAQPINGSGG